MDGPRFDALAKAWSTTRPRRALLKGLAGASVPASSPVAG
jgi:hypothetical protein